MSAACQKCGGTGENGAYGIYDCTAPDCTAAVDRTALEAAVKAAGPMVLQDAIWFAYQQGALAERNKRHAKGYAAQPGEQIAGTWSPKLSPKQQAERDSDIAAGRIPF